MTSRRTPDGEREHELLHQARMVGAFVVLVVMAGCPPSSSPGATDTTDSSTTGSGTTDSGTTDSGTTDSGTSLPAAPVLELSFSQVKQLDFSWAAAAGAEHYRLLESAAPGEPFVQLGEEIVSESISISMPLHFRYRASYVLRACNAAGCMDSEPVSVVGSLAEAVGYFKASNTEGGDYFGWSVALSGDGSTLAVGAPWEDGSATGIDGNQADESAPCAGAVYVFVRDPMGQWSQQAYVKASYIDRQEWFGWHVALSHDGSTLAVGAVWESSGATGIDGDQADDSGLWSGAVYVFVRDDEDQWSQQAYVKASNTGKSDHFGTSLALSADGNTLAVGALEEGSSATGIGGDQADDSMPEAGAVYVFVRDDEDQWSQQAYVKASNTDEGDHFGDNVALSGDGHTLAVAAPEEDSSATGIDGAQADELEYYDSGAVYVFVRDDEDQWSQQAYVKASNTDAGDELGSSLALSADGSTLAVGASEEDGSAIGIGGNDGYDSRHDSGAVYVFVRDDEDQWSQQAYVKASNTDAGDHFGASVALSRDGSTLAVGAIRESSSAIGIGGDQADESTDGSGAVYVFVREPMGQWSQQAYVKASNPDPNDSFGWRVALSGDGHTLAVAAQWEDGNATGIGGNRTDDSAEGAGAVYLY